MLQREFDRFTQSCLQTLFDHDPIDNRFDRMRFHFGKSRRLRGFDDLAINSDADKAQLRNRLKNLAVRSLSATNQRSQDHHFATRFKLQNLLHNLAGAASRQRLIAVRAMSLTAASEQQPQEVKNAD